MSEMPVGPLHRKGEMKKEALGFTTKRVIEDEMPLYRDAKTFLDRLYQQWRFQKAKNGADFEVTEADWNSVKEAAKKKWPKDTKFIEGYPWTGSAGQRNAVEQSLDKPPKGGVL